MTGPVMGSPDSQPQYVVTPWRNSRELLDLRHALYGHDKIKKERAANKVFAWRLRNPDGLPLLLDSTADIVDVSLQDEKHELTHNALRLLYATALSRFITGLADTQIDLIRDRPAWFPPGKSLQLPLPLLELRHRIVHRHLPSLAELKRASQDSLDWLWEWYWSQLDHAFGLTRPSNETTELEGFDSIREKAQALLKTYIKDRKNEIKTRKTDSKAVQTAISTYTLRYTHPSTPPSRVQTILLHLLITDKMILPTDKNIGSSMSGAFLIWTPILLAFTQPSSAIIPIPVLLTHLSSALETCISNPIREGLAEWITHILLSSEWASTRAQQQEKLLQDMLVRCFSTPTTSNTALAEQILNKGGKQVKYLEKWKEILDAAKSEGDGYEDASMDINVENTNAPPSILGTANKVVEQTSGPRKFVGMWRARPIGWREEEEWEDD